MQAIIIQTNPYIKLEPSKKYKALHDKLPMVQKKNRNCFLLPLKSAIEDKIGLKKATTMNANPKA
jgi:hypothetical protein